MSQDGPIRVDASKAASVANVLIKLLDAAEDKGATPDDLHGALVMVIVAWAASQGWTRAQLIETITKDITANFDVMKEKLVVFERERLH